MSENMQDVTILDIDELLDMQMDTVADVPDYVTPETGLYMLSVTEGEIKKSKEAGKSARIVVTLRIDATVELAEGSMPVADGSLFTQSYMGTQDGLGYFKRDCKKMLNQEELPAGLSVRDMFDALKAGDSFKARITTSKRTVQSKDADGNNLPAKTYTDVRIDPIFA